MRIPAGIVLLLLAVAARAELACDQYGAIAQETLRQRDQGASLQRVLERFDRGDRKRLAAREAELVRQVMRLSFEGTLSPSEVVEACEQGGTLVPAR